MKKKIDVRHLSVSYHNHMVLRDVNLAIYEHEILAVIGPTHSGKSSLLRCINRMIDLSAGVRVGGDILVDGESIYHASCDVHALREKIGMIFPIPVPLPMSIFENLAYGPRLHGVTSMHSLQMIAEHSLHASGLWDEVKQRLDMSALRLSGGQQQRLCLARALAIAPEIILFDEPCSGLDPISTAKVEMTMKKLARQYTIILVTNIIQQAERVSDRTAFFYEGKLVEIGKTSQVFHSPKNKQTMDYISGKFG